MPHRVRRDGFGDARGLMRFLACVLDRVLTDVSLGGVAGKQPVRGPGCPPPVAQDFQQSGGEHDIAVLCAVNGYVVLGGDSATGTSRSG